MDNGATTLVQGTPIVTGITAPIPTGKGRKKCPGRNQRGYAEWSSLNKRAEGRPSIQSTTQQGKFADSSLLQSAHIAMVTILGYLSNEAKLQMSPGN